MDSIENQLRNCHKTLCIIRYKEAVLVYKQKSITYLKYYLISKQITELIDNQTILLRIKSILRSNLFKLNY